MAGNTVQLALCDQVAVVTGAARGIGRAIAVALAEHGATLALCDLNTQGLDETLGALPRQARAHRAYQVDVGESASLVAFAQRVVREFGCVHILVNNAAMLIRRAVFDLSGAEWDLVFAVNLKAPFLLLQAVGKHMIEKGTKGCVVNIASTSAQYAQANKATYSATKAGLVHLTRCAAVELGVYGIRVNAILPGPTLTPMIAGQVTEEYLRRKGALLSGIGQPVDIANAVVFLCSPVARRVTGACFNIDSGQQLY